MNGLSVRSQSVATFGSGESLINFIIAILPIVSSRTGERGALSCNQFWENSGYILHEYEGALYGITRHIDL